MNYQNLTLADLAIAASLILVNGIISLMLRLEIERVLFWAAVRTVVQLLAIGYVLGVVFAYPYWYVVLPIMCLMTWTAGRAAACRGRRTYRGLRANSMLSVWISSWLITAIGLLVIIRIHPWYEPQYAIPILGMILGNTLTGVSLGMDRMMQELTSGRGTVEMILTLGGSRWEAARVAARQAISAGMMPTLNQMTVVGIVSLPGMMTGQVLAGESPIDAVRYQIVIMFMIAASSAIGTLLAVWLTYRRLFSADHRFLASRLVQRS
ncbi:ABC transporter permease [Pseudomonas vanderleydeniana]|uniref:Iron export ABC transporter permease subunit FetB n=1 Tax=Pseudomonas vanderleydeniana TaxID=2745495 RepID=A0A9E6PQX3_9PSED|nr:iron export ABC transporter permease subunit FetB [Pseudomonas vanderleydeniana]QXI30933.1 iron export ABC transporter permease subunit FetB [Pseudomonas vanderleydeniana]